MVSKGAKRRMRRHEEEEEGDKKRKVLLRKSCLVETKNAFCAIEGEVFAPTTGLDKERKEGVDAGSLPQGTVRVL